MPKDRMDEVTAWQNFVQTGSVNDYLAYCRVKLGYPPEVGGQQAEDLHEEGNRRTDPEGTNRWR